LRSFVSQATWIPITSPKLTRSLLDPGESARLTPGQKELKETIERGEPVIPRGNAEKAGLTRGEPVKIQEFEEDRF
jgi:hypothetical protein